MSLHSVLASNTDTILERWRQRVVGELVPASVRMLELENSIPEFLEHVAGALRAAERVPSEAPEVEAEIAAEHGEQRLGLGFSLDAVVREYGALHDVIVELARETGSITDRELQILFECIIGGVARAVVAYSTQRDAELLRQANEHFAFIAHELRNPLSSATLAAEALRKSGDLPEDSRALAVLDRALRSTVDLVDHVLRNARIASGITLRRRTTTLRALFDDAAIAATFEAQAKRIEIVQEIADDDAVSVDVRLVESALGNLVRNAVRYSHPDSRVELRGWLDHGRAVLEVEDRCGGLPPGKVEEAFSPFVRLPEHDGGKGFGLGLAIAKQAADAHGGSLRVQNLPGTGCVFVLELPVG